MTAMLIIIGAMIVSVLICWIAAACAPEGWQDKHGFHRKNR